MKALDTLAALEHEKLQDMEDRPDVDNIRRRLLVDMGDSVGFSEADITAAEDDALNVRVPPLDDLVLIEAVRRLRRIFDVKGLLTAFCTEANANGEDQLGQHLPRQTHAEEDTRLRTTYAAGEEEDVPAMQPASSYNVGQGVVQDMRTTTALPLSLAQLLLEWASSRMTRLQLILDAKTCSRVEVDMSLALAIFEATFLGSVSAVCSDIHRGEPLASLFRPDEALAAEAQAAEAFESRAVSRAASRAQSRGTWLSGASPGIPTSSGVPTSSPASQRPSLNRSPDAQSQGQRSIVRDDAEEAWASKPPVTSRLGRGHLNHIPQELQRFLAPLLPRPSRSSRSGLGASTLLPAPPILLEAEAQADWDLNFTDVGEVEPMDEVPPVPWKRKVVIQRCCHRETDLSQWGPIRKDPEPPSIEGRYFAQVRRRFPGILESTYLERAGKAG